MAPAYTSRDEDILVGQRQLLRQGCLGRTKLHGFVAGVEKVLRTLYIKICGDVFHIISSGFIAIVLKVLKVPRGTSIL